MITNDIFYKENYSIHISPPWEDFMVTYKETNNGIQRECHFFIYFNFKKKLFIKIDFVTIYLDSINFWASPKEENLTLEEIKQILKRLSDYLYQEGFFVKLDFGMIPKEQAMKRKYK